MSSRKNNSRSSIYRRPGPLPETKLPKDVPRTQEYILRECVNSLENTKTLCETKTPRGVTVTPQFNELAVKMAKLVLGQHNYKFRCARSNALISSGGGSFTFVIGNGLTDFVEGNTLVVLFSFQRILKTVLHIASNPPALSAQNLIGLSAVIAWDPEALDGVGVPTPSTVTALEQSKLVTVTRLVSTHTQYRRVTAGHGPWPFNVCALGSTAATFPPSGSQGAWIIAQLSTATVSTLYGSYMVEAEMELSNRT